MQKVEGLFHEADSWHQFKCGREKSLGRSVVMLLQTILKSRGSEMPFHLFFVEIWFCIRSKHQEYFKRIAKNFFNFSLTAVEYLKTYTTLSHHAPPPSLLATALAVQRQDSEGSVMFQKTCVFPELFFNTYTVKHYFPNSRQFSNWSSQIFSRWPALTESYNDDNITVINVSSV